MARPKKQRPTPEKPIFSDALGNVPADDEAHLAQLADMLPQIRDQEKFRADLLDACYWLRNGLYQRKRADPKSDQAQLIELSSAIAAVETALLRLGHDAAASLRRRAERQRARQHDDDCIWRLLEPRDGSPVGMERIRWFEHLLCDARRWADEAAVDQNAQIPRVIKDPPDPEVPGSKETVRRPGRPRHHEAEVIMESLIYIWSEQTGALPTLSTDASIGQKGGPFLAFCEAVIPPIYDATGLKSPSIQALVQKILYPPPGRGDER